MAAEALERTVTLNLTISLGWLNVAIYCSTVGRGDGG
jgi:hypothetical protein